VWRGGVAWSPVRMRSRGERGGCAHAAVKKKWGKKWVRRQQGDALYTGAVEVEDRPAEADAWTRDWRVATGRGDYGGGARPVGSWPRRQRAGGARACGWRQKKGGGGCHVGPGHSSRQWGQTV
jgi:hypothetical protein